MYVCIVVGLYVFVLACVEDSVYVGDGGYLSWLLFTLLIEAQPLINSEAHHLWVISLATLP